MRRPDPITEIFLRPGEFYFGGARTRIRTLLGSCVAVTVWHPLLRIGGMCHYLLPGGNGGPVRFPEGYYASGAMELFMRELRFTGTRPSEYQLKLFGGGNMFSGQPCGEDCGGVPCRNMQAGRELARRYGFAIRAEHLGGTGHRQIMLDLGSGHVWVRHVGASAIFRRYEEILAA